MLKVQDGIRIHYLSTGAREGVARALNLVLDRQRLQGQPVVFVCIGTDRSTGDALGPLVGEALLRRAVPRARVFGTLDEPAHAGNLEETLARVQREVPEAFVVAIDACLGRMENVGTITVGSGPLSPGAGVNKSLPEVGGAFVTGTVNVGGFMEYFVLQNTRLSLVMAMAEAIGEGLAMAGAPLWIGRGPREAAATSLVWS